MTLGQLNYLSAEGARTQAQTGLLQTQGAAAQAALAEQERQRAVLARGTAPAGDTLASLGTGPQPPPAAPDAAGAPPAPGGPPGGPAAPPPRRTTAEWA